MHKNSHAHKKMLAIKTQSAYHTNINFLDKVLSNVTGIKQNLDKSHHVPYKITETFTNGTVWIQRGKINDRNNIQIIMPFTKR
jgi:hypothetical protein